MCLQDDSHAPEPSAPAAVPKLARAVIFDLDGVIVWSLPMHYSAFRQTFAAAGREFPMDEYLSFAVGASREDVIRRVMGDLPDSKFRELMDAKERHVREHLESSGIDVIPGALNFVRAVRARGAKTAVATASRTPEIILRSAGALDLFDAIVPRHRVARTKPFPDIYLFAAQMLGVPQAECIVVEDSPVGVEAALAAGMRVLAITTTEPPEKLTRATAVFRGFAQIRIEEWVAGAGDPGGKP